MSRKPNRKPRRPVPAETRPPANATPAPAFSSSEDRAEAAAYDASDEGQVEAARRKADQIREGELADLRAVLATRQGRRLVWRYLTRCGVFKTSMTGSSQTFFLEGQRNVGLWLLADINAADPAAYVQMLAESHEGEGAEG